MTTDDVFDGLAGYDAEQQHAYEAEARDRWGDAVVDASARRAAGLTRDRADQHLREHDRIATALAAHAAAAASPDEPDVQSLVADHHAWVSVFWEPDSESYAGLGRMYVEDERFRATYDAFGPGTAELLRDAIEVYAATALRN